MLVLHYFYFLIEKLFTAHTHTHCVANTPANW